MKVGLVLALVGSLVLAAACGSDDEKVAPGPEDSGGAPADAGAPPVGTAGMDARPGGSGGGGAGGTGGSNSSAGVGGEESNAGGAGGAPSSAGAAGQGGATEPSEPGLSVCGAKKYVSGDGCADCPAAPTEPASVSCQDFVSAEKMGEDLTLELGLPFHELLSGQVSVSWSDSTGETPNGTAEVSYSYSLGSREILFDLPVEARYADAWSFGSWKIKDACGFVFDASNIEISYDGQAYVCGNPK